MDLRTAAYYEANAPAVLERYWSAGESIDRYFSAAFPARSRVLDVGAGSGRDLARLLERGHDAQGVEPSAALRDLAARRCPQLAGRLLPGALPDLPDLGDGQFDGIVCSAVLMHVPSHELFDTLFTLRRLLRPSGRLLVSLPVPPREPGPELLTAGEHRDLHGRLWTPLFPDALSLLAERLGFRQIGSWENADSLGRDRVWSTRLFERRAGGDLRPIDQVEGVLNRDRKFATYKLALFRALCDIARTNFRAARWRPDGTVALPVRLIAEQWLAYYWPLVASSRFIPQRRGEKPGGPKPIAFRPLLADLVERYRSSGGLPAFLAELRADAVRAPARATATDLLRKLAHTIQAGPVTFAGGSLETGRLFGRERGLVILPGGLWREICLTGHWIHDALLLRWSELTAEISMGELLPSQALDLLLASHDPERDVSLARKVYGELPGKECVWSGRPIPRRFDVDHVLPHALWRCNALWNLMPAAPAVNRAKADRLPARRLLRQRRGTIERYWDVLEAEAPGRFQREAEDLVGSSAPGPAELFEALAECVEVTALQRGCGRWPAG